MVQRARDSQRRRVDLAQPADSGRGERVSSLHICDDKGRVIDHNPVHLGGTLPRRWIDLLRLAKWSIDPDSDLQIGHAIQFTLLCCLHHLQHFCWRRALHLEAARYCRNGRE